MLALGETVIIDASWTNREHRHHAAVVAARTESELVPLRCTGPSQVAAARLCSRTPGPSDADPAIATAMAKAVDPWHDAKVVDASGRPEISLQRALAVIHPHALAAAWQARRPQIPPD